MIISSGDQQRPPIHLLASESDLVGNLALSAEDRQPVTAAMLLGEIERAELHDNATMPPGHARLNSLVSFLDETTHRSRDVQLVLPAQADITAGKISILTLMGAALYGLGEGHSITWPDVYGKSHRIRVTKVVEPSGHVPQRRRKPCAAMRAR